MSSVESSDIVTQTTKEIKEVEETVKSDLLKVHGIAPARKADGITRLAYENANGFATILSKNEKLEKAREVIRDLEVDVMGYTEHRINFKHADHKNGFRQMFRSETAVEAIAAHNVHESIGRVQEGGTALLAFDEITGFLDKRNSGKDELGLGRWTHMVFGSDSHRTRVVCGYNPCKSGRRALRSTYRQHRRYLQEVKGDDTCPRQKFREDLVTQLKSWREQGDRLIVFMDVNDDIYRGEIAQALTGEAEGLRMVEAITHCTKVASPATYFRGSKPIDGCWTTTDVMVTNACLMPVGFGVGDHRLLVVDVTTESLIGKDPVKIVRPSARRLHNKIPGCGEAYVNIVEQQFQRHKIMERFHTVCHSDEPEEVKTFKIEKIDTEAKDYMRRGDKKCRRIKHGRIPFSPEAVVWLKRTQVYRSMLRYFAGKIRNLGNLKRSARRSGIHRIMSLSETEIRARLKVCRSKCDYFRRTGKRYRRKHLHERLRKAREKEDEKLERRILDIIQNEKERDKFRRLRCTASKQPGRSVTRVQIGDPDTEETQELHTKEEVEEAIFNEVHRDRFRQAESAPICQAPLFGDFGYSACTQHAEDVFEGKYANIDHIDSFTRDIFLECQRIRSIVPKNATPAWVTKVDFQRYWSRAKEDTSSSESGLHFGHYIASAKSDLLSHFHAAKTSVILMRGIALSRWSRGLSVMLEKVLGVILLEKLRAILLMEADFNAANKLVFGVRMLNTVREYKLMPQEIFAEKNRTACSASLAKTLFFDIVRQSRVPAALASVDAANCFDRLAHAVLSLVYQSFGVPKAACKATLEAIQNMKYFLRTGFGDSTQFAGGGVHVKTQGICQGNGAGPASSGVVFIVILNAHKKKGFGAKFVLPISKATSDLSAFIFVDDTDLLEFRMDCDYSVEDVHQQLQRSVMDWGKLLIATGGALKPIKCFYHLISFKWEKGVCYYEDNTKKDLPVYVPLPDGSEAEIEHKAADIASKTLGVHSCPCGNSATMLNQMQKKGQKWVDACKNGHLHRRLAWFSVKCQFWPRLGYGLGTCNARFHELSTCLDRVYHQVLPLVGVNRNIKKEWRTLSSGFYGIGLPHAGVEKFIDACNLLLQFHGTPSSVGMLLQTSLEFMVLELGMTFQPFLAPFRKYGQLVTECWLKALWEMTEMFGIQVTFHNTHLTYPRKGDKFLLRCFEEIGYLPDELVRLNRVRIHQQVLFLSDILGAGGKRVEEKYVSPRPAGERWSTLVWGKEKPTPSDFKLWREAIKQVCPLNRLLDRLGTFTAPSHKIWEWRWNQATREIYHIKGDMMDTYREVSLRTNVCSNRFSLATRDTPVHETEVACSVAHTRGGYLRPISFGELCSPPPALLNIEEVLNQWGCTWLWDQIETTGSYGWVVDSIRAGTLVAVTDGSFMKQLFPMLCSAAFVLECSRGGGRLVGSFAEASLNANAYRGELLGLLAIHLLLLAAQKTSPSLTGSVNVYSDCLGALSKITDLPPYHIPARSKHADILKQLLVHCSNFSFCINYLHVRAHQDNHRQYQDLARPAQLNCICDYHAKQRILQSSSEDIPPARPFPLESVFMCTDGQKITSQSGPFLRFVVHRVLARDFFESHKIMMPTQFDEVAWKWVHNTLVEFPKLFQLWAAKHVANVSGTMKYLSYQTSCSPLCPSCLQLEETSEHVLICAEEGRRDLYLKGVQNLRRWMYEEGTDPDLARCIDTYLAGRGRVQFVDIPHLPRRFFRLARSQDHIGWERFTQGMVSAQIIAVQADYITVCGEGGTIDKWAKGLVTKLVMMIHSQWLYRNIVVHHRTTGFLISQHKEEIQKEIDRQLEQGGEGLLQEDRFLLEIVLEDLAMTSGEAQEYWLVAIRAARAACLRERQRGAAVVANSCETGV